MSSYTANVRWTRDDPESDFAKGRYSRAHEWAFDGGAMVPASASPRQSSHLEPRTRRGSIPRRRSIAAISSCHMLFFIDLCAARRVRRRQSYVDEAVGVMEKRADGKIAMTRVTLRPKIAFSGEQAADGRCSIADLHHRAHEDCFIANSVNSEVTIEQ